MISLRDKTQFQNTNTIHSICSNYNATVITSANEVAEVVFDVVCACLSSGLLKSNQSISLKLGVMTGPTNGKNWWTFGGDPVTNMDSRSLFHLPQHGRRGHFKRFISISHTVTICCSQKLTKWLTMTTKEWIDYIFRAIQQTPRFRPIRIQIPVTFGWGNRSWMGQVHIALAEVCTLTMLSSYNIGTLKLSSV